MKTDGKEMIVAMDVIYNDDWNDIKSAILQRQWEEPFKRGENDFKVGRLRFELETGSI
jgi:hypothetical protein